MSQRAVAFSGDEILGGICGWVRIESPTTDVEGVNRMMDVAAAALRELEARVDRRPGTDGFGDVVSARLPWGGDEPGIHTMVRTGPQTAAFHAPAGDRPFAQGDLLMIDMSGARHQYHGNTARAFSIGENAFWSDALAKLVAERDETCAQIRPGDPYSIGVWSERIQGRLKAWHTAFFWLGLICDTWGTGMMFEFVGGMAYDIHGPSGVLAIVLMFIHAIWATIVLVKKDEKMIANFHKFSVAVWLIWLIPYFSPMALRIIEAAQ